MEATFRVHLPDGPVDKLSLDDGSLARINATKLANDRARHAGAQTVNVYLEEDVKLVTSNTNLFIEAWFLQQLRAAPPKKILGESLMITQIIYAITHITVSSQLA